MMNPSRLRVLLVDDHTLFREGLCRLLADEHDFEVVGCKESPTEGLDVARSTQPDVVLVAERFANASGSKLCRDILGVSPESRVVLLGECDLDSDPLAAVSAGAAAFLLKCSHSTEICDAMKLVCHGQVVIDLRLVTRAIAHLTNPVTDEREIELPHPREMQILKLAAKGMTNKEIAVQLGLSPRTVQSHFFNLFQRLKVNSRTEAVFRGVKSGILTISDLA